MFPAIHFALQIIKMAHGLLKAHEWGKYVGSRADFEFRNGEFIKTLSVNSN